MGKKSKPQIPNAPSFQTNPFATQGIEQLLGLGGLLTQGDQFNQGGQLGFLNPLVSFNSDIAQGGIDLATRSVERTRDRTQQDIINQLEANNQLTSSTAVNRLSELNEEFSRDLSDIGLQFSLAEVQRAQGASERLFGAGLGAIQSGGALGAQRESTQNQFNLQNFSNIVAQANANQSSGQGGLFGGILGTAAGFALGGPLGAGLGGALGGGFGEFISPSQTGATATSFGSQGLNALALNDIIGRTTQRGSNVPLTNFSDFLRR